MIRSLLVGATLLMASVAFAQNRMNGQADVKSADGKINLIVRFVEAGQNVQAHIEGKGLAANAEHGIHIHENPVCNGDFSSAGDHFNPSKKEHGAPSAQSHLGDLGNIKADKDGNVKATVNIVGATLKPGKNNSLIAHSVVLHEKADDLKSQPAGDSGARIACGVVARMAFTPHDGKAAAAGHAEVACDHGKDCKVCPHHKDGKTCEEGCKECAHHKDGHHKHHGEKTCDAKGGEECRHEMKKEWKESKDKAKEGRAKAKEKLKTDTAE